jgi:NAD+ synthase (glutamine-hydrolysing)
MKLQLALAQINTTLGNVDKNLEKHMALIQQATSDGADLLLFPELSLTGYVLQDLVPTVSHCPTTDDPIFKPLLEASRKLDLVVGFVEEDVRNRFFISSAYLSRGEVSHVHRKVYLPTYGLFDEGRFFALGDEIRSFDTRFGRAGMLICEDFWHASPPYLLWLDGADLFLFNSASPGRGLSDQPQLESSRWVDHILRAYASLFTSFVAHTNRVGYEDGLNFWGGAAVYAPTARYWGAAPTTKKP